MSPELGIELLLATLPRFALIGANNFLVNVLPLLEFELIFVFLGDVRMHQKCVCVSSCGNIVLLGQYSGFFAGPTAGFHQWNFFLGKMYGRYII